MRRRSITLALAVSGLVGCSVLADFGGLVGTRSAADASATDGATPGDAAPAVDSATNGQDGSGLATDGGIDATFCEQHTGHTFCEDFDRSTTVPTLDQMNDPNHRLVLDPTVASSAPNSLSITYVSAGYQSIGLEKLLPAGQHVKMSVDIRGDYTFSSGQVIAIWLNAPTGGTVDGHEFYVESFGGPLRFIEAVDALDGGGTSYNGGMFPMGVPAGTFAHLDIVIDGATGHVTVDQNAVRVTDMNATHGFPSGPLTLYLGMFANSVKGGDAVLHIDNVLVDVN